MKKVDDILSEVVAEENLRREKEVKARVKELVTRIMNTQSDIASSQKLLESYKKELKELQEPEALLPTVFEV